MKRKLLFWYALCFIIVLPIRSFGANTEKILEQFKSLYSKFSRLSASSFSTLSVDSSGNVLNAIKDRYPEVVSLLRVNSSGVIINEVSSSGVSIPMRDISGQQWVKYIQSEQKPYLGTNKESANRMVLFWGWPVITPSGKTGGILAVKIDPSKVFKKIDNTDSVSLCLFFNDQALHCTSSHFRKSGNRAVWNISDSASLIVELSDESAGNGISESKQLPLPEQSVAVKDTEVKSETKEEKPVTEIVRSEDFKKIHAKKGNIMVWIFLGVILCAAWYLARMLKKNKVTGESKPVEYVPQTAESSVPEVEPLHSELEEDPGEETQIAADYNGAEESLQNDETSHLEEHSTNEHYTVWEDSDEQQMNAEDACEKIKSFITENSSTDFKTAASSSVDFSAPDALRSELYKEIHGQITQWVISESARLAKSLDELSDRVGKLEKSNDPEIARIRNEAQRISKEIASFKESVNNGDEA